MYIQRKAFGFELQKAWDNISVEVLRKYIDTIERCAAVIAAKGGHTKYHGLANHNTLSQLTNLSPSREGLHKPGNKSRRLSEKGQRGVV